MMQCATAMQKTGSTLLVIRVMRVNALQKDLVPFSRRIMRMQQVMGFMSQRFMEERFV